jgi:hypothetical protein
MRGTWNRLIAAHTCLIASSTISVALSEALAKVRAKAGQRFVAAPVFGRPDVAAAGQLFVITAGSADAIAAATLSSTRSDRKLSLSPRRRRPLISRSVRPWLPVDAALADERR